MSYITNTATGNYYVEDQTTIDRKANGGTTTTRRWRGIRSDVESISALIADKIPFQITPESGTPYAVLTMEVPGENITTDYQFTVKSSQVPTIEHPAVVADLKSAIDTGKLLGIDEQYVYRAFAWGFENPDEPWPKPLEMSDTTYNQIILDLPKHPAIIWSWKKAWLGIKSYYRPEPCLVIQTRYSPTVKELPTITDVGVVYDRDILIATFEIPTAIQDVMPTTGEWLCEDLDYGAASDGSRMASQTFRYAVKWDADLYLHELTPKPKTYTAALPFG